MDSNVIIYAMMKDYPNPDFHEKCLALLDKGLKGELDYILTLNPIIIVEVFSVLRRMQGCTEAAFKINSLLTSKRLAFVSVSKEACQKSVQWAKEKNVPVNDALIGASMREHADLIFTTDENHFKKLEEYEIKICNPTTTS